MKKSMSESEAYRKYAAYCSTAERCSWEVYEKLIRQGTEEEVATRIITRLTEENYLNDSRFCNAYAHDKFRFSKWGKNKIYQALSQKRLPREAIRQALETIDGQEYHDTLKDLLDQKRKTLTAKNRYELNCKLIRFATGRGYSQEEINRHLNTDDLFEMD